MQRRTDTCRPELIHADQNRYMQTRTNTCRPELIHVDQNQYMQTRADTCRPEPIHADRNHSVYDIGLLRFFYQIPWGGQTMGLMGMGTTGMGMGSNSHANFCVFGCILIG